MNFFFKKIKAIVITGFLVFLPLFAFAQAEGQVCSSGGYTIATINGIFTDDAGAKANKDNVKKLLPLIYHREKLTVNYLLNPSHSILDLTDVAIQKNFESVDMRDPDFIKILSDASAQIKTQKVLLIAHSQGNFYANNFYNFVTDSGDLSKKSIGVYSIATPASYVAGDGRHITSATDKVIAFLVKNILPGSIVPVNEKISYKRSDDGGLGHDLSKIYLQYRPAEIVKDIKWSLDRLSVDQARPENTLCINPPKALSLLDKITNVVIYPARFGMSAWEIKGTIPKNIAKAVATSVYNVALSVGSSAYNMAAKALSHLPILGKHDTATVILSTQDTSAQPTSIAKIVPVKPGIIASTSTPLVQKVIVAQNPPVNEIISTSAEATPVTPVQEISFALTPALLPGFGGFGGGAPPQAAPLVAASTGVTSDVATTTSSTTQAPTSTEKTTTTTESTVAATSTPSTTATTTTSIATTTIAISVATSTPSVSLGYTVVAEQLDRSTLDTTSVYIQGTGTEQNVFLNKPVTFSGINKGDQGRIVAWYRFGYGQDCMTAGPVTLTAGPANVTIFSPISAIPNWDGSCVFRLSQPDGSVVLAPQSYSLGLLTEHTPPYLYGKPGTNASALYCMGYDIYSKSCYRIGGYSANLSDFAYIITSDIYVPPPLPAGMSPVPATLSPVIAEQSDHSVVDMTPQTTGTVIQLNVIFPQKISFSGEQAGDKGRIVVWYSFGQGQDCSTLGTVYLFTSPADLVAFSSVSKTPNGDGSCVFRFANPTGGINETAGTYGIIMKSGVYDAKSPKPLGKPGSNSNAVFCSGIEIYATSCRNPMVPMQFSANLSDFAYLITADTYAITTADTTPPAITSYTLNGAMGNVVADFATTTPTVGIAITASENVNWVSIKIEDQKVPANDKIFFSDSTGCKDGTTQCAKSWDGILSNKTRAPDGTYHIKVHMKDLAGNSYLDYLSPYTIIVNTATSTPVI